MILTTSTYLVKTPCTILQNIYFYEITYKRAVTSTYITNDKSSESSTLVTDKTSDMIQN